MNSTRLSFVPPPNLSFNDSQSGSIVISPDGQKLAFTATSPDGKSQLWVRPLDSLEARLLPGTDDPLEPFWSPDSHSIAFGSQGKLKRVELAGGNPQTLCDASRMTGGAWSPRGIIVFGADYTSGLFQVPATGGEPRPVTKLDEARADSSDANPNFLPDGNHFIYRINVGALPKGIWVGSLDSPEVKQVLPDENANAIYAAPGWLLSLRNRIIMAQVFDAGSLQLKGESMPVITYPTNSTGGATRFSVSANGTLVWQSNWEREYQLLWFDREGKQVGAVGEPVKVTVGQEPRLSSDGKRIAMTPDRRLWVIDVARGVPVRLTSFFAQMPVWSPDGSHVAVAGIPDGSLAGIYLKDANGVGEAGLLLKGTGYTSSWSKDGRFMFFVRHGEKTQSDIWVLPLFGDRKEYPLLNSTFDEVTPEISPDGRWLAYRSDESGSAEIYVRSFTADGKVGPDKRRISTNGGTQPEWRPDGQELFYLGNDLQMMSVGVKTRGTEFEYSAPRALFKARMLMGRAAQEYAVTSDGQKFLIGTLIGEPTARPPTVILNWAAELGNK